MPRASGSRRSSTTTSQWATVTPRLRPPSPARAAGLGSAEIERLGRSAAGVFNEAPLSLHLHLGGFMLRLRQRIELLRHRGEGLHQRVAVLIEVELLDERAARLP